MKRVWILLVAATVILGCAACGRNNTQNNNSGANNNTGANNAATDNGNNTAANNGNNEGNTNNAAQGNQANIADANEILTTVWNSYGEDEQFAVIGGHIESSTENGPGFYDLTKTEDLENNLCIPKDIVEQIDDASTMIHAMNANTFSAGAFRVKNASNRDELIAEVKDRTVNNRWTCGFPEKLLIVTVGEDYFVTAFGQGQNVNLFKDKLLNAYEDAKVVVEENLSEM